jgi:hypothetical protein
MHGADVDAHFKKVCHSSFYTTVKIKYVCEEMEGFLYCKIMPDPHQQ